MLEWIKEKLGAFGKWAEAELESVAGLLETGAKQFMTEFGPAVLQAAAAMVPVVEELAAGQGGGAKAALAVKGVGIMLEQQGIKVGVHVAASLVNLAIEHAVAAMNEGKTLGAPPEVGADAVGAAAAEGDFSVNRT